MNQAEENIVGKPKGVRRRATLDKVFAWLFFALGAGRIVIAVVRRESAGAEVGIATALAMLAAYELLRIWHSRPKPPVH